MEKQSSSNDDSLLNYLDGTLDSNELKRVELQIQQSTEMRMRLDELRAIHTILQRKNVLEIPSKNFTQRVLNNLDSFKYPQTISPKNGMFLLGGIMVAVGITLSLISSGSFDSVSTPLSLNELPLKKEWIKNPLPTFLINAKQVMKVIMILATGLSFVLLDRTILRPLFARRSKMQL